MRSLAILKKEVLLNSAKTIFKTILYRIVLKHLTRRSVEKKCRKAKELINSPKVSLVSFDVFDTCIIRSSYLPSDVQKYMDANHLKCIEEAEKEMAHARKCIQDLYQYAVNVGKRVIAVSDMYLGSDVLSDLLINCGYHDFSHIYVRCECGTTKSNDTFFNDVARSEKVPPKAILHIGDDMVSDWWRAKKSGWQAVCIPSAYNYFICSSFKAATFVKENFKTWEDRSVFNFVLDRCEDEGGLSFKRGTLNVRTFAVACLFPYLYRIADFLIYNPEVNADYEKIYFLSRDGYLPMKAYNMMRDYVHKGLEAEYLYGSRYTLHIEKIDDEDKIRRIGQYYKETIKLKEGRALVYDTGYSGTTSKIADYFDYPCKIDKVYLWQRNANKQEDKKRGTRTLCLLGDLPNQWLIFYESILSDNRRGSVEDIYKKDKIYEPVCNKIVELHNELEELTMMQEKALSTLFSFLDNWEIRHIECNYNLSLSFVLLMRHYLSGINPRNYRFLHNIYYEDQFSDNLFKIPHLDYFIIKMKMNESKIAYCMKSMIFRYYKKLFVSVQ